VVRWPLRGLRVINDIIVINIAHTEAFASRTDDAKPRAGKIEYIKRASARRLLKARIIYRVRAFSSAYRTRVTRAFSLSVTRRMVLISAARIFISDPTARDKNPSS